MKQFRLMLMMTGASLMFACQTPAPNAEPETDPAQLRTEIQALEDAYAKASNEKNVEGILAYYADDAQRLPPEAPRIQGKAAIRSQVEKDMASDTSGESVKFEVLDLWTSGDLAVEIGSSTETGPDGTEEKGKYIAVFQKRDGKWLCIADMWNEDSDDDEDAEDDQE